MKKIFKEFFFKDGKFIVLYFWASLFSFLIVFCLILKMCGVHYMSDELILGLMGFVTAILGLYNFHSHAKMKYKNGGDSL